MPGADDKVHDPKLAAMLELERRGELPGDLKPQLQMYRQQGITKPLSPTPPTTPADNAFANDLVLAQIGKARDLASNHWTTGWGDYLSGVPATPAHDLASTVGTIRSNLAINELAAMRASSPTGGALGNVTEGEERLLSDKAGALNQSDSQEHFLYNLSAVQQAYGRLALKYKGVDPDSDQGKALLESLTTPPAVDAPGSGGTPPPTQGGQGGTGGGSLGTPPAAPPPVPVGTGEPGGQSIALSPDGSSHFSTAEDKKFAAEANVLLKRAGSSRADFDALAARYGRDKFGCDLDRVIAYRNKGGIGATVGTPVTGYTPPSTLGKVAASPAGAAVIGAADGVLAGHLGGITSSINGDPDAEAKVGAVRATHPGSYLAGEIAGGTTAAIGGEAALARVGVPALAALGSAQVPVRALAADALYGGAAGYNSEKPVQGVLSGAALGMAGGVLGRKVGSVISPTVGKLGALYENGVRPTLGQRFADSGRVGAAINAVKEASQSLPVLGMLPRAARQDARDQFERGAFNSALSELDGVPGVASTLPKNMKLGTQPHAFMQEQFDKAYSQARSGMSFSPDKQYIADLQVFRNDLMSGVLNDAQVQQVRTILNRSVQTRLSLPIGRAHWRIDAIGSGARRWRRRRSPWRTSSPSSTSSPGPWRTMSASTSSTPSPRTSVGSQGGRDHGYRLPAQHSAAIHPP